MELKMTIKEADKYVVIKRIESKKINLKQASLELSLSYRQTRRVWNRYKKEGNKGLISKKRGKPSNNQILDKIKYRALFLIKEKYIDYGPTLAKERLEEKHNVKIGKETLRQLMIKEGIWKSKKIKNKKVYARRTRRSKYGELVQIDGSYHNWFEDRGDKCCLLVSVDDATSSITGLKFCKHETTYDYLEFLKNYITKHGKPISFYSDKHSVFRVNNKKRKEGFFCTKFQKILKKLDIELICANSPQAKGRVERANGTLQDRLVKWLREKNINSIKEGNKILNQFILRYNKKFSTIPAKKENAHKKALPSETKDDLYMLQEERTLSKDLSFQYNSEIYQIESKYVNRLSGKKITVYECSGEIKMVMYNGKNLQYKKYREKINLAPKIIGTKELEVLGATFKRKEKKHHPWR